MREFGEEEVGEAREGDIHMGQEHGNVTFQEIDLAELN